MKKAKSTFLWVALVYEELKNVKPQHIKQKLDNIPSGLEELYDRIYKQISTSDDADNCKEVLHIIHILQRPIHLDKLRTLVPDLEEFENQELEEIIGNCGSFLFLRAGIINFVHQSAQDFIIERTQSSDIVNQHRWVLKQCLEGLKRLKRNPYGLESPGVLIEEVQYPEPDPLSPLHYSCVYWVDHMDKCKEILDASDKMAVGKFIEERFLYWLEALSLHKKMREAVNAMQRVSLIVQNTADEKLNKLVEDAGRFVLMHKHAIEMSPLQVYVSALIFSPTGSLIRTLFQKEVPDWIKLKPEMPMTWPLNSQILEGHSHNIRSVTFSTNGQLIAVSSWGVTVKIWEVALGHCRKTFKLRGPTRSLAFIQDDEEIAILFDDGEIEIWDLDSGSRQRELPYDSNGKTCNGVMVSSPNGKMLALLCLFDSDSRIKFKVHMLDVKKKDWIWATNLAVDHPFTETWKDLAFSPKGQHLVSISGWWPTMVDVWDVVTGARIWMLKAPYNESVRVATFLTGSTIALACEEEIMVWDLDVDTCVQKIEHPNQDDIFSILRLDPGGYFATNDYNTIKVWDNHGACVHTIDHGAHHPARLAGSANQGRRLIALASGTTVKIWDLTNISVTASADIHKTNSISLRHEIIDDGLCIGIITDVHNRRGFKIVDTVNASDICTIKSGENELKFHCVSIDRRYLITREYQDVLGLTFTYKIWSTADERLVDKFPLAKDAVFTLGGQLLAIVFNDHTIGIWDAITRTMKSRISADAVQLVSETHGCNIGFLTRGHVFHVWDIITQKSIHKFILEEKAGLLAISRDSQWLATISESKTCIWDVAQGATHCEITDSAMVGTFSPNAKWFAFAWFDEIKVLDMNSCNILYTIVMGGESGFRFDKTNDSWLHTKFGILDLERTPQAHRSNINCCDLAYHGYGVASDGAWVVQENKRVLWLPFEYRKDVYVGGLNTLIIHQ